MSVRNCSLGRKATQVGTTLMPGNAMSIKELCLSGYKLGEEVLSALKKDEVRVVKEGSGVVAEGMFEGGEVYVVGHNVVDVWTGKTKEKRVKEFKEAIEKAYKPGVDIVLITCFPCRLPEELRKYTLDGKSKYEWTAKKTVEGVVVYEDVTKGEEELEKLLEEVKEKHKEWCEKEEMKKFIKEWELDWRYVKEVEEVKVSKKWVWKDGQGLVAEEKTNKKTMVTYKGYKWERGWLYGENRIFDSWNNEVLIDAPELGYQKAVDL